MLLESGEEKSFTGTGRKEASRAIKKRKCSRNREGKNAHRAGRIEMIQLKGEVSVRSTPLLVS